MKKVTGIFFGISIIGSMIYSLHASTVAGFNMTGAPGEGNCSSCHIGTTNPDLKGSINILVNGESKNTTFVADSVYEIEVISSSQGTIKFGFALNAREKGIEFINAGTFLSAGDSGISISDYVTHTSNGTSGNNVKSWKFKWKAPNNPSNETITLYAAGVMANNDQNTQGDKVYADTITLKLIGTFIDEIAWKQNIAIKQLDKDILLEMPYVLENLKLHTLDGKEIPHILSEIHKGKYVIQTQQPKHGIILISVQTNLGNWAAKTFY